MKRLKQLRSEAVKQLGFTLAEVFYPAEQSKRNASRIIRAVAGVTSRSNSRAGFAIAHTAPYRKFGFTLAEVLITLGIIGVVAALTIPSLIQKHQEKVISTQLKEFYSVFSQALLTASSEQGEFDGSIKFYEYIKPYLKIQKDCGRQKGCFPDVVIKTLDGKDWVNLDNYTGYHKLVLNNGALLQIFSDWDNGAAEMRVDVNGFKGPNTLGRDIFYFKIKNNVIKPSGIKEDERFFETHCNLDSTENYNGDSCTAWVLYNENLDYLHCNDLSWDGKRKCK